jgi:LysM repeat protein
MISAQNRLQPLSGSKFICNLIIYDLHFKTASIKTLLNKYVLSCIFCFASFIFLSQTKSTNIQTIGGVKYYIHKIDKGQSLYSISKLYNVSLEEIYSLNPETKSGTKANQEIKIPFKEAAVQTNTVAVKSNTAAVKPNTVAAVPNTLAPQSNSIVNGPNVNQPIDTSKYFTYVVSKKETVYAISKKFNISETELKILNPSIISQGIKEGQTIIVGEKKRPVVKQIEARPPSTNADSINPKVIHKPKKTAYNLALLLPFKLDQSLNLDLANLAKTNANFPAVPALAVDFYLGFKKAADSLAAPEFELNIDVFDIDDKDSVKLVQILNDPKFKQTDFIFGPLHANGFKTIAQKAQEFGIPAVSPITQQNKMLYNNVYASKVNPSQFTLLESLADYCIDSLLVNNANIILMAPFGNDAKENSYVKAFKKYFNDKQKLLGKSPKDTVTVAKDLEGVKKAFIPNVRNIIVTLSTNQVFIANFTTQLAIFADKKDVTLCGWRDIGNMENIDQEYLNQLHYTFPSQYNITNTNSYSAIIESYKAQQNIYPGEITGINYYFIGFDMAYYYLKNLKETGPDFIFKLNNLPAESNYMRFKFTRPDNLTGFDNRGIYIFKYNDYQLLKTGWK